MATHQILRVEFSRDATEFIVASLREEAARADLFAEAPVVYVAGHERRARDVRRQVGIAFPEGTPERVARDLIKRYSPEIELHGGVDRDFDFFAFLHEALAELSSSRPATRALVDELLGAWRRMADALPPTQRNAQALQRWLAPMGERGRLLASVAGRYRAALADKHDADDVLWLAADLIPRWARAGFAPALVLIDELDVVSAAREHFLRALLASGKRGLAVLRGSGEHLPFLRPALDRMQALVLHDFKGNAHAAIEGKEMPRGRLCEAWLRGESGKLPAEIALRRPASRAAEVRDAARAIKRLARTGTNLESIAVVLPNAGKYRGILESTFASAGIPFDAPLETPLAQSPPVAALLELMRAARGGLERAELLDVLASPLLPFGDVGEAMRAERHSRIERATRSASVVGGVDVERDWLAPLRKHATEAEARADVGFLAGVFAQLEPFTRRELRPAVFFDCMKSLAEASGVSRVLKSDGAQSAAGQRALALHEFGKLLREMREGFMRLGSAAMPVADLARALLEQAQTRTLRPVEPAGPHVRVLGMKEMRGARFEHVLVLGLCDEDLPLPESDSMFFPRTLGERLAPLLGEQAARALCLPVDAPAQADYLFANALLTGARSLVLSLPRQQGDKPFVPAAQFARLLGGAGVDFEKLGGDGDTAPVSLDELALSTGMALREIEFGAKPLAPLRLDSTLSSGLRGRAIELARDDETAAPGRFEGWVQSEGLAARFGAAAGETRHTFSPSQIDTCADCPMRFWMRYVLHLKKPDEPTRDTPPTAIGTLVHRVLEAFVHALRLELGQAAVLADPLARSPVRVLDLGEGDAARARIRARELMLGALARAKEELNPHGPFWAGTLAMLASGLKGESALGPGLLARFIDDELERNALGFGVRFVELRIGTGETASADEPDVCAEPVELAVPGGSVRLHGSIDRVDESAAGLQIIDYKTGSAKSTADIRDGAAFQLPLYLAAVSAKTGVAPYGMAYYQVPLLKKTKLEDVTRVRGKPALDVTQLVTHDLPRRLAAMLGALARGVFVHLPSRPPHGDKSPCGYCEFSGACARRDEVVIARQERAKENSEALRGAYRPDAPPGKPAEAEA